MVAQCVHCSFHLCFSACHTVRILIGGISSRGFRCDPWAPVSDLCWACVFGRERLVQKLASPLPHLAALHDAFAVCFPFWQFDLEEAKKVQKMFHGLCGDIGGGWLFTPAVKRGTVDFTEPRLVTGSGSGSQAYCSRSQRTTEAGQTSYPAVCCLDGVADYGVYSFA